MEKARELLSKHLYNHGGDGLGISDGKVYLAVLDAIQEALNLDFVMQRSELLLFADYSESDKTSQTTDECVDNYLAEKSNSA